MNTTTLTLTPEQGAVVDSSADPGHLVVEALAGTGKTSTVEAITKAHRASTLYIAFNRQPVNEAKTRMASGVRCATIHELAYRAIGDPWTSRTRAPRMKSSRIANLLGLDDTWLSGPWGNKRISAGFLGGMVTRALQSFAKTGDDRPGPQHVPIPRAARNDPDMLLLFREIRSLITPTLAKAWQLTTAPDGELPLDGNMVIKMWQLSGPILAWDRIIIDEAQDLNDAARALQFIRAHAAEMEPRVCARHIELYVNAFSADLGDEGRAAVEAFVGKAVAAGVVTATDAPVF